MKLYSVTVSRCIFHNNDGNGVSTRQSNNVRIQNSICVANGLGIGLYQCRQIIEAHGGRCVAESREGEGSVFTVYLPGAGEPAHAGR